MMHNRIGNKRNLENSLDTHVNVFRYLRKQAVECLADHRGHLLGTLRMHHHVGDATHQIFAKANLRIHQTGTGEHFAAGEIAEMGGDRGRTDIDGHAIGLVAKPRPQGDDAAAFIHGHGDPAFGLAQCRL